MGHGEDSHLVKEEQKRQSIRIEVLEDGLMSLTREVAKLREDMDSRFDALEESLDRRFAEQRKVIADVVADVVADGNAAIISALMPRGKKRD